MRPGANPVGLVKDLESVAGARSTVGGVNRVVGFRPSLWRAIAPHDVPEDLADFDAPIEGADGYVMPATQADLWVWFAAATYDTVFDFGRLVRDTLAPHAELVREERGWTYHSNRDLTGFQDGTKNPTLDLAPEIALIAQGPGAGGSVLLFQQWRHDGDRFDALAESEQERVIGRTKRESVEFDADVMPENSHVQRTTVDIDGSERKIFRRNVAYGTVSDHGTMFVGFCASQVPLKRMLEQMAGIGGPRDALTRYSAPLTGAYYFIPSTQALAAFAPAPAAD
jgi:putative iron-dependent peroxidase